MKKYLLQTLLLLSIGSLSVNAATLATPKKAAGESTIDAEFLSMNPTQVKLTGSAYKRRVEEAEGRKPLASSGIDSEFSNLNPTQAKIEATKWKREIEVKGLSSPSRVPAPTVHSSSAASGQTDLDDILHKLDDVSREVRALRVHSDITPSNLSGAFDQHATADDRALNLAFKDSSLVEAYKAAKKANSLAGFWPVVKAAVLKKLTDKINEIQPGDDNADLLIQPSFVFVVHAAKKGEFLVHMRQAIESLDFADIAMPANDSAVGALSSNYMQKINAALWALIDTIVPGKDDSIILHGSIDPNRMKTNQSPRTKLAFRNVFLGAIK